MKLIHLADLHLGKRVNEFSMIEDQAHILQEILSIVDGERPQAVLLAGDIYDKAAPSAEAVRLLDDFLFQLSERGTVTMIISGNHDSAERIAFGGRLMEGSGVYVSPVYDGHSVCVELEDEWGAVRFYLLPYFKPAQVRPFFEREVQSYSDAVAAAVEEMGVEEDVRNVLLAHHFVTGGERCESEQLSVGGSDNVDAAVFAPFDYVALGHLHGPQHVLRQSLRYAGSPLKYSFSEREHVKSVTVVELGEKGSGCVIRTVPLQPLHELREIRGSYGELTLRDNYAGSAVEDYLHIILTDEEDVPDAMARLRTIYPNAMKLDYDNARTRAEGVTDGAEERERKEPWELFAEFYEQQNGKGMSGEQRDFSRALLNQIWEEQQ